MIGMNPCRIDAKLTRSLDDATANVERLEKYRSVCRMEVGDKLLAAHAAWIEHKMTCRFCSGQQFGRIH
jgi:hypothetical protein